MIWHFNTCKFHESRRVLGWWGTTPALTARLTQPLSENGPELATNASAPLSHRTSKFRPETTMGSEFPWDDSLFLTNARESTWYMFPGGLRMGTSLEFYLGEGMCVIIIVTEIEDENRNRFYFVCTGWPKRKRNYAKKLAFEVTRESSNLRGDRTWYLTNGRGTRWIKLCPFVPVSRADYVVVVDTEFRRGCRLSMLSTKLMNSCLLIHARTLNLSLI